MPRKKKDTTTGADHAHDTKTKRGPGKPKAFEDADAFARAVDDYINYNISCNQGNDIKPPMDFDFCTYVGISPSTLDNYRRNQDDKYPGYLAAYKKLVQYREQYFMSAGLKNPKLAGVTNFALKQPKNGGYEDKPTVQVEARELKIVHGSGMTDDSFK